MKRDREVIITFKVTSPDGTVTTFRASTKHRKKSQKKLEKLLRHPAHGSSPSGV